MGLDVYVMPLWKFKAGDFASPIEEALGVAPKYASTDGLYERPASISWWARFKARREAVSIRREASRQLGTALRWNDEGQVVFSCQWPNFDAIRAYAAWLDRRDVVPEFTPPPNHNYSEHPIHEVESSVESYPQLLRNSFHTGYLFPCEFDGVVQVDPFKIFNHWDAWHTAGSAPRLLRELDGIQESLRAPDEEEFDEHDPLSPVKQDYRQLRDVLLQSARHGLPIIFWG